MSKNKEDNVAGWADLKAGMEKELTDEEMIYFSPAVATAEQLNGLHSMASDGRVKPVTVAPGITFPEQGVLR